MSNQWILVLDEKNKRTTCINKNTIKCVIADDEKLVAWIHYGHIEDPAIPVIVNSKQEVWTSSWGHSLKNLTEKQKFILTMEEIIVGKEEIYCVQKWDEDAYYEKLKEIEGDK